MSKRALRDVNTLTNDILRFVDRNGVVVEKSSTPQSNHLSMRLDDGHFFATFNVYQHAQGNGSCSVEVKWKDAVVFKATGNYVAGACNMKATVNKGAAWQQRVPGDSR